MNKRQLSLLVGVALIVVSAILATTPSGRKERGAVFLTERIAIFFLKAAQNNSSIG